MLKSVAYEEKINANALVPGHLEKLIENIMNRTKFFPRLHYAGSYFSGRLSGTNQLINIYILVSTSENL